MVDQALLSAAPLTRDQVTAVIEGRATNAQVPRVPVLIHFWLLSPDEFGDRMPAIRAILERYPMDAQIVPLRMPGLYAGPPGHPSYRWFPWQDPFAGASVALDERVNLASWDQFDRVLTSFPDPLCPWLLQDARPGDGRYRLGYWWYWLFERHWSWRGMVGALTDYVDHPAEVHRLFRALTDFYKVILERGRREGGLDGVMISDDLGTQKAPFFSLRIFNTFFRPYYAELIEHAHSLGLHLWLHACGNITPFLPSLVDLGIDVIHPIQKHAMDYAAVAQRYGDRVSFWAGVDLQQVIPWGTPAEVRAEVRQLIDSFHRPEGRLLLAASNAIHADCSDASLEAMLDEAIRYGLQKRQAG